MVQSPNTRIAVLAIAAVLQTAIAAAQTDTEPTTAILPDVVVAAPTNNLVGVADTASQGVVVKSQIEAKPAYRVGELLETVPGLIVTQHSGEGKANQYFLRGFNLDHGTDIAIGLDDMPVNMRTHAHGQGYSDLNFMIPELVNDIHYRKGSYFADDGDFATAGSVRIDYVDALPHDIASFSIGTLGDYRGMVAMSRPQGQGTLLVALEYNHLDGPWTIPDNFNKGNMVVRYSQGTPENGWSVTGMYMRDGFHATNQIPQRAVIEGLISIYDLVDPTDEGNSERFSLSAKYVETTATGQFKANAYAIGYSLTLLNDFDYSLDFPPPINDQFQQRDHRWIYGGNVSYAISHKLLGRESETTIGFQTRTDDINLGLGRSTDDTVFAVVRNDHVVESSGGLYAENRTQWLEKFRTIAGLRGDLYDGLDHSTLPANSGNLTSGILSPKTTAVIGPWSETEIYASWGQGFHSNDVRGALTSVDAYQTFLNQSHDNSTIARQNPTPLLTKAVGYEIGVRTAIVPNLQTTASLFVLDLASELVFGGDAGDTSAGRPSQRKGFELTAFYTPTPWLTIDANYAHSDARFTSADDGSADTELGHPGHYIPGATRDVASAGISITGYGPWQAGLRFRYFGPRPLIEDNSVRSKPTALTDLRVGYRLASGVNLRLDIYNLFNSYAHQIDYFYASQLPNETSPVYDVHFHPVEPISARFTVTAEF